jgi:hypothetical protein
MHQFTNSIPSLRCHAPGQHNLKLTKQKNVMFMHKKAYSCKIQMTEGA